MKSSVYKIIVIDDNPAICEDISKILLKKGKSKNLTSLEEKLFELKKPSIVFPSYRIDAASRGQEGVELIAKATHEGRPYTLAFVDIRMPSGWDGIETIERIWKVDKDIQVVICTAYSDYSWEETIERLGSTDRLLLLKKPFDNLAVQQLAFALTKKWELSKQVEKNFQSLEDKVEKRTNELNTSLSLVKATLDSASDAIVVINNEDKVIDFNNKFLEMMSVNDDTDPSIKKDVFNTIANTLESPLDYLEKVRSIIHHEENEFIILKLKNGKVFEQYSQPQVINNRIIGSVHSFRDVTERFHHEEALHYQATHDALTQLPNRILMFDKLQQAIAHANQNDTKVVMLFFDIDRFKIINDSLGHKVGDLVLQNIAMRINSAVRKQDVVSRIGGDEFVVIITDLIEAEFATQIVKKLLSRINEPFSLVSQTMIINASIGISVYPDDASSSSDLIKNADAAMYQAKTYGNTYLYYSKEMDSQGVKYLAMDIELKHAITHDEFVLHYQPQINLVTGKLVAAEALIRWNHPERGLLNPHDFIPFAEKTGIISKIGEWALRTACKQNKLWQKMGLGKIVMAVNVSNYQLRSGNFLEIIRQVLEETNLEPQYLELELTESYMITEETFSDTIKQIKEIGVQIALDDFGTGYSNFTYLKQIPVDKLKIDRSFIQDVYEDKDKETIVRAIIAIALSLNINVTAEGVETLSDLNFLKAHECSYAQGFYFSRPLTNRSFTWLLRNQKNFNK